MTKWEKVMGAAAIAWAIAYAGPVQAESFADCVANTTMSLLDLWYADHPGDIPSIPEVWMMQDLAEMSCANPIVGIASRPTTTTGYYSFGSSVAEAQLGDPSFASGVTAGFFDGLASLSASVTDVAANSSGVRVDFQLGFGIVGFAFDAGKNKLFSQDMWILPEGMGVNDTNAAKQARFGVTFATPGFDPKAGGEYSGPNAITMALDPSTLNTGQLNVFGTDQNGTFGVIAPFAVEQFSIDFDVTAELATAFTLDSFVPASTASTYTGSFWSRFADAIAQPSGFELGLSAPFSSDRVNMHVLDVHTVPEPGSLAMLLGLAALAHHVARSRRRTR